MSSIRALLVGALVALSLATVRAEEPAIVTPPALTELQKLKAEKFQLEVQVAQLTATLQDRENRLRSVDLSAAQLALVEEFRAALKADKEASFNWRTLTFEKAAKIDPALTSEVKQ